MGNSEADAELVAEAVAQRCSVGNKPDGSPKAPQRYAIIWQAARLGALEYAKMSHDDHRAQAERDSGEGVIDEKQADTLHRAHLASVVVATPPADALREAAAERIKAVWTDYSLPIGMPLFRKMADAALGGQP